MVLCDRYGNRAMPVEGYRAFYGPGSDTLNIIDHRTGMRRKPGLKDVEDGVTLCDALPGIDFLMSMVLPMDVDQAIADRYQMEIMLSRSSKPIHLCRLRSGWLRGRHSDGLCRRRRRGCAAPQPYLRLLH